MKFAALGAALLVACAAPGPKEELEAMFESDQLYRLQMQEVATKEGPTSPKLIELLKKQQPIDEANTRRLGRILEQQGWPRLSVVGEKAAMAAFLVVQHSGAEVQKACLPLLRAAVAEREARPQDLALLEDRVLMGDGKKQRYGSQLQQNGTGGWEFYPIEDEANVDKRRVAFGLPPLAEYARQFGFEYRPGRATPAKAAADGYTQ